MEAKKLMFTDVEFMPTGGDVLCRFIYKLEGDNEVQSVLNPDAKWLMDFISEDKPYIVFDSDNLYSWYQAFYCAIASESKPLIISALKTNATVSDDDLCNIFRSAIEKYDPQLTKAWIIDINDFLEYIDIPVEKVWKWKGE